MIVARRQVTPICRQPMHRALSTSAPAQPRRDRCGAAWLACSYSRTKPIGNEGMVTDDGGELCTKVRWIDAHAAASSSKRSIVGEEQKLTLEQRKIYDDIASSDGARGVFWFDRLGVYRCYEFWGFYIDVSALLSGVHI